MGPEVCLTLVWWCEGSSARPGEGGGPLGDKGSRGGRRPGEAAVPPLAHSRRTKGAPAVPWGRRVFRSMALGPQRPSHAATRDPMCRTAAPGATVGGCCAASRLLPGITAWDGGRRPLARGCGAAVVRSGVTEGSERARWLARMGFLPLPGRQARPPGCSFGPCRCCAPQGGSNGLLPLPKGTATAGADRSPVLSLRRVGA